VQATIQNLTSTFSEIDSYYGANNSHSIQVFTGSGILCEHYHTAPSLSSLNSSGVKQVDAHTVYRIGSLTKIFTMYAFLLEAGYQYFSHPITDFVPELAALASWQSGNAITNIAWGDVTIGDLASHLAGIASDCEYIQSNRQERSDGSLAYVGDVALTEGVPEAVSEGFPLLLLSDIPDCGYSPMCTRQRMIAPFLILTVIRYETKGIVHMVSERPRTDVRVLELFANFARYYPAVAVAGTPIYSNVAYQILAYAMQTITGKNVTNSLDDALVGPLNLTRTFYTTPDPSIGVIPGTLSGTEWSYNMGIEGPQVHLAHTFGTWC
jgi:CubicO group peptidase (beta-lactamase class C family)